MNRLIRQVRKAVWQSLEHDVLNTAKATAYSGMLMLFPALVVLATAAGPGAGGNHAGGRDSHALSSSSCPPIRMDLLQSSLQTRRILSAQLVFSGTGLSIFAGAGHDAVTDGGLSPRLPSAAASGASGSGGSEPCC